MVSAEDIARVNDKPKTPAEKFGFAYGIVIGIIMILAFLGNCVNCFAGGCNAISENSGKAVSMITVRQLNMINSSAADPVKILGRPKEYDPMT